MRNRSYCFSKKHKFVSDITFSLIQIILFGINVRSFENIRLSPGINWKILFQAKRTFNEL